MAHLPHAKLVADDKLVRFWQQADVAKEVGCYVFAMHTKGGGVTPWYVGKATKSFKTEVFSADKLNRYNKTLARHSGRPSLFFVSLQRRKGPVGSKAIAELEKFLIEVGFEANPKLKNKRGRKRFHFYIQGVFPAKPGEATAKSARVFRRMMEM